MAGGRAQVLRDGDEVGAGLVQVAQRLRDLLAGLAHAEDEVGLGDQAGRAALRQHVQRALVGERGPDRLEDAGDRLDVVREHLGGGVEDLLEQLGHAVEVRHEDLHARPGAELVDLADRLGVQPGAAVGLVVAGDAGHGRVAQAHRADALGHAPGLVTVQRRGLAGVDLAEVAAARALLAADEERRLLVLPALEDVGAAGLLADGVQPLVLHQLLQRRVLRPGADTGLDPRRLLLDRDRGVPGLDTEHPAAVRSESHDGHGTPPTSVRAVPGAVRCPTRPRVLRHGAARVHRAPAGRHLRRPAGRGPDGGGVRLRRLLPLRPLPGHGQRRRPARPDRRLGHPGRAGPGDLHHPARHAGDRGDLPPPGPAGDHGRAGGRHVRRTGRAGAGRRLVRRGARRLRAAVPRPGGAVRPLRGAAGHPHRSLVDARRGHVLLRGPALEPGRLPGPAQAGAGPRARGRRGQREDAHPAPGRRLRPRVQRQLPVPRRRLGVLRRGSGGRARPWTATRRP